LSEEHLSVHLFDGLLGLLDGLILDERVALDLTRSPVQIQVKIADVSVSAENLLYVLLLSLLVDSRDAHDVALH